VAAQRRGGTGIRGGGRAADPHAQAVEFIGAQAKAGKPFFLYMPLNSPHTPIVPTKEWQGRSGLGAYGDFVMETDWAVGEVVAALEKDGIAGNTLLILTSDYGCSPAAGIPALEKEGHFPSELRRGHKTDIFDGKIRCRWSQHARDAAEKRCCHRDSQERQRTYRRDGELEGTHETLQPSLSLPAAAWRRKGVERQ
jgi:hypothetical protein